MIKKMPHKTAHHRARQKPKPTKKSHLLIRNLVLSLAVIEPLMTIPQIYQIWVHHQTAGVSLLTWSFFCISAMIWTVYGFQTKDKAIIISSVLWAVTEGVVVLGVLLF